MSFSNLDERLRYIVLTIFLVVLIVSAQIAQDNNKKQRVYSATYNQYIQPLTLSGKNIKQYSFGFSETIADYYWLKTIQYYGGGDPNGKYEQLPKLYNSIVELSPEFLSAYESGLLVLSGEGFAKEALLLGNEGLKNMPNSWQIPYYMGLVEHIYNKNYVAAAQLFEKAAKLPQAPANTKYFSAIYFSQANKTDIAYAMFKTIYENSTNSAVKERAGKYVIYLENVNYLNSKIKEFKTKFDRNPKVLAELVTNKIIKEIPSNPLEFDYYYNAAHGTVVTAKP